MRSDGRSPSSLYINRIRMSVCPSVCCQTPPGILNNYRHIIYRSKRNYPGMVYVSLLRNPDTFPDTSVRKPDSGRKKGSKIAFFRLFLSPSPLPQTDAWVPSFCRFWTETLNRGARGGQSGPWTWVQTQAACQNLQILDTWAWSPSTFSTLVYVPIPGLVLIPESSKF